jgi:hypothetical protein
MLRLTLIAATLALIFASSPFFAPAKIDCSDTGIPPLAGKPGQPVYLRPALSSSNMAR